ncbi:MAG: beta-glucosidase, partial [Frankiaceae bacterium]|nr:beta-glucosidase [Frankiaceae bacterium]
MAMTVPAILLMAGATPSAVASPASPAHVIVQALPGALSQAERAVTSAGGKLGLGLQIINGFAATVPAGTVLGHDDGVLAVTPDRDMHLATAVYDPIADAGGPLSLQSQIGAKTFYQNGYYGSGVGVALIDSGVVPEDGLTSNVRYGPDFTPQVNDPTLKFLDTFGHGTFMAGLISGRAGAAVRPYNNPANFTGVAPEATLVSIKVADDQGNTLESAVVAGVDWAAQHKTDTGLNIRVINLSVGMPDPGYANDPLAAAVERAWSYGITVVSSVGNDGTPGVTLPAADPYVIAVGALDNNYTSTPIDDSVAAFSNTGTAVRNPDLVAPGTHIVSLRNAGSSIDNLYSSTGAVTTTLFRGSGTSQASAITAGAAALLISQRPNLTPDQVKALLTSTARAVPGAATNKAGAGSLNLAGVFGAATPANAPATYPHATGFGSFANAMWGGSWSGNVWQSPAYTAPTSVLLSQGKPATASSTENALYNPASYAVDGNAGTRWSSGFSDNQWLTVDLGAKYTISGVTLTWEAAYGKAFQIQTSMDNVNWTSVYSTTTGAGGVQTLDVDGSGRYVRMYGTARGTQYGYALWEFGIYGNVAPPPCGTVDAAANRPAVASSSENATYYPASSAFDGNPNTRWSSAFSDGQWLQVDLGSTQSICEV